MPDFASQMQAVWDAAADAVVLSDTQGIVLAANPAYYALYGYGPEEVLGQDFAIIFPPEQRAAAHADYQATFTSPGIPAAIVSTVQQKDGTIKNVEVRYSFLVEEGRRTAMISLIRDITQRRQAEDALAEQTRLLTFTAAIGAALIQDNSLPDMLQRCAQLLVDHLGAAFARIWTLNADAAMLELEASAGIYTHTGGRHGRVPVGQFKIGQIAAERRPHLTNAVQDDPRIQDPAWARREGLVSFAGYPLLIGDRLVGVIGLFARQPLPPATLEAMATAADGISLGIVRKQGEAERARLVAQEQAARAEADRQRSRLHDLFMQAPAAVLMFHGPDFVMELINRRGRTIVGPGPQVGAPLLEALPDRENSPFYQVLETVYRTGQAHLGQEILVPVAREGHGLPEDRSFNFVTQPTRDRAGRIDGVIAFAVEVTDQVRARHQVEDLAARLQQAVQLRDEFLSIASHELKTPLTSIKGLAQLALRRADSEAGPQVRRGLLAITQQIDRLTALINELLDLSHLDSGRFELQRSAVDLGRLVAEVAGEVQVLSEAHPIHVATPAEPVIVPADRERLRQVLVNLLENAVKYSPAGGPVDVRLEQTAARAVVAVQDRGIGIPADQVDRLFERFYRARNATEAQVSGLGLGLYISREIIDQHGGQLRVESQEGHGSTFSFWLPRAAPPADGPDG